MPVFFLRFVGCYYFLDSWSLMISSATWMLTLRLFSEMLSRLSLFVCHQFLLEKSPMRSMVGRFAMTFMG